ncbi:MAG: KH domain-containing protein [Ignavibacteriales bacterium]|nr:KH domain-containing protein [Ignavibacteriales bacterium]
MQVSQLEGEQTTILELKVAPEDLGKVIGKQGRTARADPRSSSAPRE